MKSNLEPSGLNLVFVEFERRSVAPVILPSTLSQNANYDQAVETYNQTILDAIKDISGKLTALKWFAERVSQQRLGVETATEAALLAEQRYSEGLASHIDALYVQDQKISQQRALAQLNARGLLLHAELSRALTGGYSPFVTPETKTE